MPYKKNPMRSERCCSLARKLIHTPQEALSILSDQGLERTLDDSAGRRILLPDSLLTAEAMLITLQNVFEGLTVQTENVARIVREELPFLGLEKAMMWLTEEGVDRQKAHSIIRTTALEAKKRQATDAVHMSDILQNSFFDSVRDRVMALVNEPIRFTGRCESQTVRFITQELRPAIQRYFDPNAVAVQLNV
ncbi:Adenylosuccinate lyase [Parelaphostrongylus tenuis]|uniref:Adenylosuccinate lyase n=1 Tax=Parelaphostrongylus tenuis TaxID=148309 RepID=A0AAD5LXC6_PARTN|nr:Adenylosuccinate lyase [Parelaphostrongylus tenuis]